MVKFKTHPLIAFDDDDKRLDAYVPLTKLHKATIFKLKMIPENLSTEYSVFIRGQRKADTFLGKFFKLLIVVYPSKVITLLMLF